MKFGPAYFLLILAAVSAFHRNQLVRKRPVIAELQKVSKGIYNLIQDVADRNFKRVEVDLISTSEAFKELQLVISQNIPRVFGYLNLSQLQRLEECQQSIAEIYSLADDISPLKLQEKDYISSLSSGLLNSAKYCEPVLKNLPLLLNLKKDGNACIEQYKEEISYEINDFFNKLTSLEVPNVKKAVLRLPAIVSRVFDLVERCGKFEEENIVKALDPKWN
eukprot:TRINITY_DN3015_c0_g1_i4.p1 TRINITY_DN3015_c0_g1~~TRINITY_DN3015_c0_g1_i4.p1  ORF type:complete len:220 (-),score=58.22 TRINITY_DN3015_c0_g1_i4:26-685(-)